MFEEIENKSHKNSLPQSLRRAKLAKPFRISLAR